MADPRTDSALARELAGKNALWSGMTVGAVLALGLFVATMVLVLRGGQNVGQHLGLLGHFLPGYTVTTGGAFLGAFWGLLVGVAAATPAAWFYYLGVSRSLTAGPDRDPSALGELVARIRVPEFAIAGGSLCGLGLFLATLLLVMRHEPGQPLGTNLSQLSQYLPGYTVSVTGSVIGLAYFLVLGAAAFACVGVIYNRLIPSEESPSGG